MKNLNNSMLGSVALLILFLVLWQWGPGLLGMPEFVMPHLSRVAQESVVMWQTGGLLQHTLITAFEIIVGFGLGALLGVAIGVSLGLSPPLKPCCRLTFWPCKSPRKSPSPRCS